MSTAKTAKGKKENKVPSGEGSQENFGQKHLVKCRCVLPQMKNATASIAHQFVVFSEIEAGAVKPKFAQCNNCGLIHKVIDICKSEIMPGKEAMTSILTAEDIKHGLNLTLIAALERHNCDLATWEHAKYVVDNKRWGEIVILTSELEGDEKIVKYVRIMGDSLFKIDTHIRREAVDI